MELDDEDDFQVVATKRTSRRGSQTATREGSPEDRSGILSV